MAEENTGQEQSKNAPTEETTSQNTETKQPYKVFESENEWKSAQDSFFKGAYNEGKDKAQRDVLSKFAEAGIEAESLDDVIDRLNNTQKEEKPNGEVEELRKQFQQLKEEREQLQNQMQMERMQRSIDQSTNEAFSSLDGELMLDKGKVETLFFSEYEVQEMDGQYYAVKNGVPELDDSGNRKSLQNTLKDFVRRENLMKPSKKGAGGSTGGAVTSDKPSRSEWSRLLKSVKQQDREKAAVMYNTAKQTGWAE